MLVMRNPDDWLDLDDPWGPSEAADLLQALRGQGPCGAYERVTAGDGRPFLLSTHAEAALLLEPATVERLTDRVRLRFGLQERQRAALWWGLPPLEAAGR